MCSASRLEDIQLTQIVGENVCNDGGDDGDDDETAVRKREKMGG